MLNKNKIIEQLYLSKGFTDCLNKMEPDHLRDDLKAEVALILLETPDEKILKLEELGQLGYYAVRIIINQIQSNTSPFARKYRQFIVPLHDDYRLDWIQINADHIDCINGEILIATMVKNELNVSDMEDESLQEREQREDWEDQIKDLTYAEIDKLYWYDKEMVLAYQKYGSFRAMEKNLLIPFNSCYHTVNKAMKTIKRNVAATRTK